jgi:hypothetical protein
LQVSKPAAGGLMSNPAIFSSVVSLCVVSLVNFFMRLNHNSIWTLKKSYFASLLVGGGCVPFSLIIVDLYYVRFFNRSIIGGNGLADGVILSTIYEPLIITIIMAAFSIFLNLSSSTRKGKLTKAACG